MIFPKKPPRWPGYWYAWYPVYLEDDRLVWLERVWVREEFLADARPNLFFGEYAYHYTLNADDPIRLLRPAPN